MENALRKLFDYQRFEQNSRLESMLAAAEADSVISLSDEELLLVNAAGESGQLHEKEKQ